MSNYLARLESEESAKRIYLAAGRLAINWGQLEVLVDTMIVRLRNRQRHPNTGHKYPDFPVSFSKKRDEVKDRLKSDPELSSIRPAVVAFLAEAKALHDLRVTVVHGLCQGTDLDGRVRFTLADMKGFGGWRTKRICVEDIERAADRMLTLYSETSALSASLPM